MSEKGNPEQTQKMKDFEAVISLLPLPMNDWTFFECSHKCAKNDIKSYDEG